MSLREVDRIVAATLYEGYILYPYRPSSVKNQVRWTFGGVHPRAYSEASGGTEAWVAQTECLLRGDRSASVDVSVRFLQLVTRTVVDAANQPVAELRLDGVPHRSWEEAVERSVDCGRHTVASLLDHEVGVDAVIPAGRGVEPLRDASGADVGAILRDHEPLACEVSVSAQAETDDVSRVRVTIRNTSEVEVTTRESALRRALVSTHAILAVEGARWLSLADPPGDVREAASRCRNTGLWPILIGEPGAADTVLASPIILDDHPQLAPESAGDLFDATEIDEILSLRILTLTDEEKEEMRAADTRTRAMLERTESLTMEDLMRMHGTIRELRPVQGKTS